MSRRRALLLIAAAGLLLAGAIWLVIPSPRDHYYTPVDIEAMGAFGFDPASGTMADVPPMFRQLDGRKVEITGEFIPSAGNEQGQEGRPQLVYRRYNGDGWPLNVQQRVFVNVDAARAPIPFDAGGWVTAFGTLHVKPVRDPGGHVTQIYSLDVDRLADASAASSGPSAWELANAWQRGMVLAAIAIVIFWASVVWARRSGRKSIRERGADPCPVCGYDARVRTTPRCPECDALLDSVSCR